LPACPRSPGAKLLGSLPRPRCFLEPLLAFVGFAFAFVGFAFAFVGFPLLLVDLVPAFFQPLLALAGLVSGAAGRCSVSAGC
jgi:hypothetical protein